MDGTARFEIAAPTGHPGHSATISRTTHGSVDIWRHDGDSPPVTQPGNGFGGGDWVQLTTAQDEMVAHLIQGRLAEEGIECLMERPSGGAGSWLKPFGDPMAPVRLFVHRHDLSPASIVLHEVEHSPPDPSAPPGARLRLYWWMIMLTIMAVTVLMALEILDFAPCVLGIFCL